MALPSGRGFYIWRLPKCEGGDIARIIARCKSSGISWLAIKAGNGGIKWSQFTPELVAQLKAAGISVYGWSYDVPNTAFHPDTLAKQAQVAAWVAQCGADGFLVDAEIEWEKVKDPDAQAENYVKSLRAACPAGFTIGHAPFDVIAFHQKFPYTKLGALDFVSPQAYWPEHCKAEEASTKRALEGFAKFAKQRPEAAKPLVPGGYSIKPDSGCSAATVPDMLAFERRCRAAGCRGVIFWVWDKTPTAIFDGLAGTTFPAC